MVPRVLHISDQCLLLENVLVIDVVLLPLESPCSSLSNLGLLIKSILHEAPPPPAPPAPPPIPPPLQSSVIEEKRRLGFYFEKKIQ